MRARRSPRGTAGPTRATGTRGAPSEEVRVAVCGRRAGRRGLGPGAGRAPRCPRAGSKASTTPQQCQDHGGTRPRRAVAARAAVVTLGRCCVIPWISIQPGFTHIQRDPMRRAGRTPRDRSQGRRRAVQRTRGCLGHTGFSTVTVTVGSGGGRGLASRGARPASPPRGGEREAGRAGRWRAPPSRHRRTQAFGARPRRPPPKGAFRRSRSHRPQLNEERAQGHTAGGWIPTRRAGASWGAAVGRRRGVPTPPTHTTRTTRSAGPPADLQPSGRLQVF